MFRKYRKYRKYCIDRVKRSWYRKNRGRVLNIKKVYRRWIIHHKTKYAFMYCAKPWRWSVESIAYRGEPYTFHQRWGGIIA
jgi:hypothetical protein